VTFPDAQIGWLPFAVAKGVRAVSRDGIDVILGSSPPYSAAVVAWLIAAITKRPLVLDFRDGWVGDPMLATPTGLHAMAHRKLEAFLLSRADCILCYGDVLADRWRNRYPDISGRIFVNPNGFDPEDFVPPAPRADRAPGRRRTIIWTGSLYERLHRAALLTLLDACALLPAETKAQLQLCFVGRTYAGVEQDALRAGPDIAVQFISEQPHSEAVRLLLGADAALMLLMPGNLSIVSNKVFEYLGAGMPILALIEDGGACAKVLRQTGRDGYIASPTDVEGAAEAISRLFADGFSWSQAQSAEQFSRRITARSLAHHLNAVAEALPSPRKESPGLQKH
jgi:glycosyltransferase involved in cell wall biosynthesis